ncbi:hypothetical protein [Umezawaea sp. Da 62-37]|uniref:hypothetical protein n=1 Tax=Umezawaea sp. Da 62-37 TaxID=3075927 RepID=UPI0028F6C873|nr:hypothetical protein [Umezawaea sp. Da 62-37]WNV82268.1 hypothetical protein RM788_29130 [Umezawaea sp. Da 62-37]
MALGGVSAGLAGAYGSVPLLGSHVRTSPVLAGLRSLVPRHPPGDWVYIRAAGIASGGSE